MFKNILIICLCIVNFHEIIAQNQIFDAEAERRYLLTNVQQIPAVGTMGGIFLSKSNAFPVLVASKGNRSAVVAASSMGDGKVVAFGHDGFFSKDGISKPSIQTLLNNAIRWAANDDTPLVLLRNLDDLADYLETQNFKVKKLNNGEKISTDILENVKVIVINPDELNQTKDELEAVKSFIKSGKGGLFCGLGWGWQQLNPSKSLKKEHKGNLLLAEAGLSWIDGYVEEDVFKAQISLSPLFTYAGAKKYVLANNFKTANKADFSLALNVLLDGLPMVNEKSFAIASDFPGNAPIGTPTVSKKVTINTQNPYWHCTGLYAQAGAKISINLQENLSGSGSDRLKVRIGSHTDELYEIAELKTEGWKRMPEVSLAFDLQNGLMEVFNPFGGMIYIEAPENYQGGNVNLIITGAVEAPFFKLGQTSLEEWTAKIRNNPAPWGEIEGDELAITVESKYLRNLDNPQQVAQFWDKIQVANKQLSNWKSDKSHRMRIVFDRQISAGYMHSGYPIMALTGAEYTDEQANVLNLKEINKWGFVHELGHNHQEEAWTFEGTEEVTCNLFSMYALEKVIGVKYDQVMEGLNDKGRAQMWNDYLKTNKSFEKWKSEPFLALIMYIQLVENYGWDALKKVFIAYQQLPEAQRPKNDNEKRDTWLKIYSKVVGEDLSDFFDAWNVLVSIKAKNSLKNLPKADTQKLMNR